MNISERNWRQDPQGCAWIPSEPLDIVIQALEGAKKPWEQPFHKQPKGKLSKSERNMQMSIGERVPKIKSKFETGNPRFERIVFSNQIRQYPCG